MVPQNIIKQAITIYSENDIQEDGVYYDYPNDRIINKFSESYLSTDEVIERSRRIFTRFEQQASSPYPSRCEIRVKAKKEVRFSTIFKALPAYTEIASYPGGSLREYFLEGQFDYLNLLIGLNSKEREIAGNHRNALQSLMRQKIRTSIGKLEQEDGAKAYVLKKIEQIDREAYVDTTLRQKGDLKDLYELWGKTFGWSMEQCEKYAKRPEQIDSNDKLLVMREKGHGRIIASGLFTSEGELTDGAVREEFAQEGFTVGLLLYAFGYLLHQSLSKKKRIPIPFAFAWSHSLFSTVLGGMWNTAIQEEMNTLKKEKKIQYIPPIQNILNTSMLTNSFAMNIEGIAPDEWNRKSNTLPDGRPFTRLRSFMIVHFNRFFYGPDMQENLRMYEECLKRLGDSSDSTPK